MELFKKFLIYILDKLKKLFFKRRSFADELGYFMFVDEGIMLNKNGSLLRSYYITPPDSSASNSDERAAFSQQINDCLCLTESGWVISTDIIKLPVHEYPLSDRFEDPMLKVFEDERRRDFRSSNDRFKIVHCLTLTFHPPKVMQRKIFTLFVDGAPKTQEQDMTTLLRNFVQKTSEIEDALSRLVDIRQMTSEELLSYLHYCITGRYQSIKVPDEPMYLNEYIGQYNFVCGVKPRIDSRHIGVVAISGYPQESESRMLEFLLELPFEMRFSTRFCTLSQADAIAEIKKVFDKWNVNQIDLRQLTLETFSPGSSSSYGNDHAANKADLAHQAMTLAQDGDVKFGFHTAVVVVVTDDAKECERQTAEICQVLRNHSLPARIEDLNAVAAYLGSFPSSSHNIRKFLIHTLNLAHLLCLHSPWQGERTNPNPMLPLKSSPLFLASTTGGVSFNFNNYVSDVGHSLIIGPIGAGKSALLALFATSFLRQQHAQVYFFDRYYGFYAMGKACRGNHYDILSDDRTLTFCPLENISSESEIAWASSWIEELVRLQGVVITPEKRKAIRAGLEAFRSDPVKSLSNYFTGPQDAEVKTALEPFVKVKDGVMSSLLDGDKDIMQKGNIQIFETHRLLQLDRRYSAPVLLNLFHLVERRLTGHPVLIAIDEAWVALDDPIFSQHLRQWLRELRKQNACVVFCSQHVDDVLTSPLKDVLVESTPVKVFLPNPQASSPSQQEAYLKMGLTYADVNIIAQSTPKKHYYYCSSVGKRLIDLRLGKTFLSFLGRNRLSDLTEIDQLIAKYGQNWPSMYLRNRQLVQQADWFDELCGLDAKEENNEIT